MRLFSHHPCRLSIDGNREKAKNCEEKCEHNGDERDLHRLIKSGDERGNVGRLLCFITGDHLMSYIGNTPANQNFVAGADQFNGTGSQTVFTLSRNVNTVFDMFVTVSNVPQDPFTAYSVAGNSLTFTSAPPSGTGNIDVVYRATNVQQFLASPGSVGLTQLSATGTASVNTFLRGDNAWAGTITSGTAVASTSGTSIDFTGIPATAKRITVMFNGVSTNGTSATIIQLGDSGGIETTGYLGSMSYQGAQAFYTTGIGVNNTGSASALRHGSTVISLVDSSTNTWSAMGVVGTSGVGSGETYSSGSAKSLSATLDRVRITTVNGTDTFDAGTINIMWES